MKSDFVKIAVTEELYADLKSIAAQTDRPLGEVCTEYFELMCEREIKYPMDRTDLTVSAKNLDLDAVKVLAGKSNLNVKDYVKRYSKQHSAYELLDLPRTNQDSESVGIE
jgi:hypothetical protein